MEQLQMGQAKMVLASERKESNKLAMSSKKASAVMAARMLDFVREMSLGSDDLTQRQSDYWIFVLQSYPPNFIEQAFHQWVKKSKHMPVPAEIIEILDEMLAVDRRAKAANETKRYLSELRETREKLAAEGMPHGQEQLRLILRSAAEMVKTFPTFPDPNRAYTLKERFALAQTSKPKPARNECTKRRKDISA